MSMLTFHGRLHRLYPVAATLVCAVVGTAHAQVFPACKSLRIVIAYPAGGPTDTQGRIIAQKLGERLAQNVIVENRGGAGTVIATAYVAKAPPDGCTLLQTAAPFAINPIVMATLPYDTAKDLAPVTQTARFPQMLVVHPVLPVKTVRDLVRLAAATPGAISYASSGNLGTGHLAGELLSSMSGVNFLHISYKGSAPAQPDVIAGRVPVMFDSIGSIGQHVAAGKLRAIAVTTATRSAQLPAVPTVAESGFPGYEVYAWQGLVTTGGTPRDVVTRISAEISAVLAQKEMRERFALLSAELVGGPPEQFEAFLRSEAVRWSKVIRERNIKSE
ncbi:MAG TPA: tripartite tricarboxylate transporter substrate binding protein [Burkholderiales bacterium]|nr:tripartite tricarboxylate transporter substrate binding protein [Burkholderiales bacterium]